MKNWLKSLIMSKEDKKKLNEKINQVELIELDFDGTSDVVYIPADKAKTIFENFGKKIIFITVNYIFNNTKISATCFPLVKRHVEDDLYSFQAPYIVYGYGGIDIQFVYYNYRILIDKDDFSKSRIYNDGRIS